MGPQRQPTGLVRTTRPSAGLLASFSPVRQGSLTRRYPPIGLSPSVGWVRVLLVLLGVLSLCAATPAAADPRIIGGEPASQTYRFLGSVQRADDGAHLCGAVLITPLRLLTAAHCVIRLRQEQVRVRIGGNDRTRGGVLRGVTRLRVHDGYNPPRGGINDVAMIKLDQPVHFEPVRMADRSPEPGTQVRVIGWGQTCVGQPGCATDLPKRIRQLDTHIAPDSRCQQPDRWYHPEVELCVETPGDAAGSCYGDSGGPALARLPGGWSVLALVNRGPCAMDGTIYADVAAQQEWIQKELSTP